MSHTLSRRSTRWQNGFVRFFCDKKGLSDYFATFLIPCAFSRKRQGGFVFIANPKNWYVLPLNTILLPRNVYSTPLQTSLGRNYRSLQKCLVRKVLDLEVRSCRWEGSRRLLMATDISESFDNSCGLRHLMRVLIWQGALILGNKISQQLIHTHHLECWFTRQGHCRFVVSVSGLLRFTGTCTLHSGTPCKNSSGFGWRAFF